MLINVQIPETIIQTASVGNLPGTSINEIQSVDLIYINSWDECMHHRFDGQLSLIESAVEAMDKIYDHTNIHLFIRSNWLTKSTVMQIKAEEFIEPWIESYPRVKEEGNYVIGLKHSYIYIVRSIVGAKIESHKNLQSLMHALSAPQARYTPIILHPSVQLPVALEYVLKKAKLGEVSCVYCSSHKLVDIYLVDEKSCVYSFRRSFTNDRQLFKSLYFFLQARKEAGFIEDHNYYKVVAHKEGDVNEKKIRLDYSEEDYEIVVYSLVIHYSDVGENKKISYILSANDQSFSQQDHGEMLFHSFGQYLIENFSEKLKSPAVLAQVHIHCNQPDIAEKLLGTVPLLKHKVLVESKVNEALLSILKGSKGQVAD